MSRENILVIAGSDPCGGAGLQADLKTAIRFGVYPATVVTAITAQSTLGVIDSFPLGKKEVGRQLEALFSDMKFKAVKTGMLPTAEVVEVVGAHLRAQRADKFVLDPVISSQSGFKLIEPGALESIKSELLPLALVVTPNRYEAELLCGSEIHTISEAKRACEQIARMGAPNVVLKGGHAFYEDLQGTTGELIVRDIWYDGTSFKFFDAPRIETRDVHGTGCSFATAIASCLAKGQSLHVSIRNAKHFINEAIVSDIAIGRGYRVVNQNFNEGHHHGNK